MPIRPIHRLLVANRGEIAIRIFRACTELQIHTIGIYAREDRFALHRVKADESYEVGAGRSPVAAYLDIEGIVALARSKQADAIHPGYGFLAESADFARACAAAGIVFVGPTPEHLDLFGDKAQARRAAQTAGLPLLPGTQEPVATAEEALTEAAEIGYPVMVKAVFGGGGRGIRLATDEHDLRTVLTQASSEAKGAFGHAAVYLEAAVPSARHIEVQILGDGQGGLIHLYERDCSVQRRHQKVVEVAPAVALQDTQRDAICAAALQLMSSVGYRGAGTVEFLLAPDGRFYFLEVNPRIQVEHTVTELVTGVDLVHAQIRVAEGHALADPLIGLPAQDAVRHEGFAVQCRVTAEDPKNAFLPDVGRILTYRSPGGYGIRLDGAGAEAGAVVSPHYDSLLVKCCAWAPTFPGAVAKMRRALGEFRIRGVRTNLRFLLEVVGHPLFRAGRADTGFIDRTPELLAYTEPRDRGNKLLAYIGDITVNGAATAASPRPGSRGSSAADRRLPASAPAPLAPASPPAATAPDASPATAPDGLRPLLLRSGPEAVLEHLRRHPRLHLTDTTFRDAHQSLLAARVRTHDLLAAAAEGDYLAGVFSLEMWGGATFDTALRFLKEDPWKRLTALRAALPNTLFQMLLRGSNAVGYANYPDNVVQAFVAEAAATGIDLFRIFDSLNWVEGMKVAATAALRTGRLVEGAICYTGDCSDPAEDIYTVESYLDIARELKALGVHLIGIKDMAGVLRPAAADLLVRALRDEIGLPVHLHTHDTAGTGVATVLAAAAAGVEIADVAVASMAGGTSQPSLTAVVAALQGTPRDTGIDLQACDRAAEGWAQRRALYAAFESPPGAGAAGVYLTEMPGGQYTNLRAQAEAVGLADRWSEVAHAYRDVDRLLGRIVKVTPSSKAVGDFALFLVQRGLAAEALSEQALATPEGRERAARLDFPESVVQLLSGQMGQPRRGFPPLLQAAVCKAREPWHVRPGALLPPIDLEAVRHNIAERRGGPRPAPSPADAAGRATSASGRSATPPADAAGHPTSASIRSAPAPAHAGDRPTSPSGRSATPPADTGDRPTSASALRDALTAVLYEAPFRALEEHLRRFGDTSTLDTPTFFGGMHPGDETAAEIEPGKTLVIRLVAIGEAGSDGRRTLHFELNGTPRAISVIDQAVGVGGTTRPVADPVDPDQVGSPMPGRVLRLQVERGAAVHRGDPLIVIEAMKMETLVRAPHDGQVTALPVVPGDTVRAGDLLAVVRRGG